MGNMKFSTAAVAAAAKPPKSASTTTTKPNTRSPFQKLFMTPQKSRGVLKTG